MPTKSSFIPDLISFLTGNFDPVSGCILLPECFTKTVTDAFFENSTGALSRKLVIERQDTVYSQCIIFYVRDREFDAQMKKVRSTFTAELKRILNIASDE